MKRFGMLFLCGLLLLTAGCAGRDANTPGDPAAGALTLTPLTGYGGPGESTETEAGLYEVRQCPDSTTKIAYIDYATGQETWLCSRPNCDHADESCTAWFPAATASVFVGDGKLYVLAALSEEDGMTVRCLYRMNPDGSDRKELYRFPDGDLPQYMIVSDGRSLYFTMAKWSEDGSETWLCRLDTTDGQLTEIREMAGNGLDSAEWILGAYDSKLSLCTYTAGQKMEFVYYTLDLVTGETREFFRRAFDENGQSNTLGYPYGRYFYYLAQKENALADFHRLDPETGEDVVLCDHASFFHPDRTMITGFYSGMMAYSSSELVDGSMVLMHEYYIDLASGALHEIVLRYDGKDQASDPDGMYFVYIRSAVGDDFLVRAAKQEAFDIYVQVPEGGYTITTAWPIYAFISKEDYFAGNPNYRYVDTSLME